jgi:hypothetical protein
VDEKLKKYVESDADELNADDLIERSGDFRGHVYEKVSADDVEPTIDWHSLQGKISETRIEDLGRTFHCLRLES